MKKEKSAIETMSERACEMGQIDGYRYLIVPHHFEAGAHNGYIIFPSKPVKEESYNGILTYVPVHGGITYAEHDKDGSMYGFDTVHFDSHNYPRGDREWIKEQIDIMLKGILKAKEVELKYLKCTTNKGRAKWAQIVQDIQPEHAQNFGVSLNLLSGQL